MHYFTREWHSGEMSDADSDRAVASYQKHLQGISDQLPPSLLRLARDVSVHDGLFKTVTVSDRQHTIGVQLRCGDRSTGYYDLNIEYRGAELAAPPLEAFIAFLKAENPELLYQEIDVTGQGYEHRLLLYPYREVVIQFEGIDLQQMSVESREVGLTESPSVQVL